jgi:hypothetical protein
METHPAMSAGQMPKKIPAGMNLALGKPKKHKPKTNHETTEK